MAKTVRVSIRMAEDLQQWFKEVAEKDGVPYTAMMCVILRQYMDSHKNELE